MFHGVPGGHNACTGLECISDVSSGGGVGVAVIADKGEALAKLAVAVLG